MAGHRDILVAYHGSPNSERALDLAIALAQDGNARLTVLTAVRPIPCIAYTGASGTGVTELRRGVVVEAEEALHAAADKVPADIPLTTVFSWLTFRSAVRIRIEQGGHDLVVLGSRDRGLVRRSPVPVLIAADARRQPGRTPASWARAGALSRRQKSPRPTLRE